MIGEITSLEKIKISAHLAVQLSKPLSANPTLSPMLRTASGKILLLVFQDRKWRNTGLRVRSPTAHREAETAKAHRG